MFTKIKYKLLFFFLLVGVLPLALTIYIEYDHVAKMLRQRSFDQLTAVRESKKKKIEEYFRQVRQEISFLAQSNTIINAMKDFKEGFDKLSKEAPPQNAYNTLKKYYTEELLAKIEHHERDTFKVENIVPKNPTSILLQNQYLIGNKNVFQENAYHQVHERYHTTLSTFLKTYGYYDIFLIDDQTGYIVYSVAKEIDFATSLLSDAHKNTNIACLFRQIRLSGVKNQVLMCDFEPYLPSYLAPAAFLATPIFEGDKKIGTLIFQLPIDRIDAVMTNNKSWREEGFGETGESYIVGSDYKMRSNSRFIIEDEANFFAQLRKIYKQKDTAEVQLIEFYKTTVLFQTIRTEATIKAVGNRRGTEVVKDYRGVEVLSSFTPIDIPDVKWVILSEIDSEEAFAPVRAFAWRSVSMLLSVCVLVIALSFLIAHSISSPIMELVGITKEMSKGNLDIRVKVRTRDEIGVLGNAFNESTQSLKLQREALIQKQKEIEQQMEEIEAQAEALKKANEEIAVRNEELRQNMEEIEAQRDDILEKTIDIQQQKEEIEAQRDSIEAQNQILEKQKDEIELQKFILEQEKNKAEDLLLNILPREVARELQETGTAVPRQYKKVTVLFTDIKNFTSLVEAHTPQELVEELNLNFTAFDAIVEKYGLERIKTIGDSYMCAGGIPEANDSNPTDAVAAGLEMQAFMQQRAAEKLAQGLPPWRIRVGIHTGEIIAGVVGKKKFAYDIWGDTVNLASRIESSGEAGKVNISETTYQFVKHQFRCVPRGKIEAKNKGLVDMYFVESAL